MAEVAPYAGAWIETSFDCPTRVVVIKSLPTRERGLKPLPRSRRTNERESLPTRERGLKRLKTVYNEIARGSLPTRERGLKLSMTYTDNEEDSRSLRGSVD